MIRPANRGALAGAIVFTTAATAILVASAIYHWPIGTYAKMAASTGFLATAIAAGAWKDAFGRTVFAGLVCSWWGDYFLTGGSELYFLLGLCAFLLGHIAYAAAFLVAGVKPRWFLAGVVAVIVVGAPIARWLAPHLGDMRYPVYAYIAVISLMVALAIGTQGKKTNGWLLAGAILFYLSDIFVSRQRFVTPSPWNGYIGLPVYFFAQLLLAYSILPQRARKNLPRHLNKIQPKGVWAPEA